MNYQDENYRYFRNPELLLTDRTWASQPPLHHGDQERGQATQTQERQSPSTHIHTDGRKETNTHTGERERDKDNTHTREGERQKERRGWISQRMQIQNIWNETREREREVAGWLMVPLREAWVKREGQGGENKEGHSSFACRTPTNGVRGDAVAFRKFAVFFGKTNTDSKYSAVNRHRSWCNQRTSNF